MKKTWIVTLEEIDGKIHLTRRNDGFDAHELLGIIEFTKHDIIAQMAGIIKPDFVKREYVERENQP